MILDKRISELEKSQISPTEDVTGWLDNTPNSKDKGVLVVYSTGERFDTQEAFLAKYPGGFIIEVTGAVYD